MSVGLLSNCRDSADARWRGRCSLARRFGRRVVPDIQAQVAGPRPFARLTKQTSLTPIGTACTVAIVRHRDVGSQIN